MMMEPELLQEERKNPSTGIKTVSYTHLMDKRNTLNPISIIITKRILHYLQKWDLKYSVYPLHGQEFFRPEWRMSQTKQDWHCLLYTSDLFSIKAGAEGKAEWGMEQPPSE